MGNKKNRKRPGTGLKYRGSCNKSKKAKVKTESTVTKDAIDDAVGLIAIASTSSQSQNATVDTGKDVHEQTEPTSSSGNTEPVVLSKSAIKVKTLQKKKSKKKLKTSDPRRRSSIMNRAETPEGFRLVNMNQLSKALLAAHVCPEGEIYLFI